MGSIGASYKTGPVKFVIGNLRLLFELIGIVIRDVDNGVSE